MICIRSADSGLLVISIMIRSLTSIVLNFTISSLRKLCDKSLCKAVWAKQEQTYSSCKHHEETSTATDTKTPQSISPRNTPPQIYAVHPVFIMCKKKIKIKPWGFSDQKLQWSVSPLDALPCVCGVIRNSRWPVKNSRSISTSTATWERRLPGLLGSGLAH